MKLSALTFVLIALAPFAPQAAAAESRLCTVIQPGETALLVAQRMTGEAKHARDAWFQIVDPEASRVVPKEGYDYVRAGWNACVVTTLNRAQTAARSGKPTIVLWTFMLLSIGLATYTVDIYFDSRRRAVRAMQQFGTSFVHEFARPLVRPDSPAPPIQSRFRVTPLAARLDIFIAPAPGRRYPNLADHRNNVEYDLERVLKVLRDQPFVNGPPYTNGRWVVVPFQWKPRIAQAGGK